MLDPLLHRLDQFQRRHPVIGFNVVRAKKLWPRSMTATLGEADHRAMRLTMSREALSSADVLTLRRPPHR